MCQGLRLRKPVNGGSKIGSGVLSYIRFSHASSSLTNETLRFPRAFTLIEMITVMAIILILGSLVLAIYRLASQNSAKSKAISLIGGVDG